MSDSNKQLHSSKYYQERFSLFWPIEKIFIFRKVTAGESLIHFFHTATFPKIWCAKNSSFWVYSLETKPKISSSKLAVAIPNMDLAVGNSFTCCRDHVCTKYMPFGEWYSHGGTPSRSNPQKYLFRRHAKSWFSCILKVAVWKKWIKLSPAVTLRKINIFSIGQNRENRSW